MKVWPDRPCELLERHSRPGCLRIAGLVPLGAMPSLNTRLVGSIVSMNFCVRAALSPFAKSYRRELPPLSADAHQRIVDRIQAALARIGTGLRGPEEYSLTTRLLAPTDLIVPDGGWETTTEDTVQRCLDDAGWTDVDYVFKPEFQCRENNRQAWEKWLDTNSRRLRLLILVHAHESGEEITSRREAEALLSTSMAQRLAASSSPSFSFVEFDPEATAKSWLSATVTDLENKLGDRLKMPLDQLLPPITRYQRVFHDLYGRGGELVSIDICSSQAHRKAFRAAQLRRPCR